MFLHGGDHKSTAIISLVMSFTIFFVSQESPTLPRMIAQQHMAMERMQDACTKWGSQERVSHPKDQWIVQEPQERVKQIEHIGLPMFTILGQYVW